jgi:hypothetical protein
MDRAIASRKGARDLKSITVGALLPTGSRCLARDLIDELADLMMMAPDQTERPWCGWRGAGDRTHLVVATQMSSTDIVTDDQSQLPGALFIRQ